MCSVSQSLQLFEAPWTVACQAPLSMRLPRQEYWSVLPFPTSKDLPGLGIEPTSPESPSLSHLGSPTIYLHGAKFKVLFFLDLQVVRNIHCKHIMEYTYSRKLKTKYHVLLKFILFFFYWKCFLVYSISIDSDWLQELSSGHLFFSFFKKSVLC